MISDKSHKWFYIVFGLCFLLGNVGVIKMHTDLDWFRVSMATFGIAYGAIIIDRQTERKL